MKHYHVKRLQRTLDNIHAQLKAWRQRAWMDSEQWETDMDKISEDELVKVDTRTCGTAGCLAGWGAADAGATFVARPGDFLEYVAPRGRVRAVLSGAEEPTHVRRFAMSWFGLSDAEATAQFDSENSYHRLWALAMLFSGGRLTLPAEVTQDQADGADEQGSTAYVTDNFPADVVEDMERLVGINWAVENMDEVVRTAALRAAKQQADARTAVLAAA